MRRQRQSSILPSALRPQTLHHPRDAYASLYALLSNFEYLWQSLYLSLDPEAARKLEATLHREA